MNKEGTEVGSAFLEYLQNVPEHTHKDMKDHTDLGRLLFQLEELSPLKSNPATIDYCDQKYIYTYMIRLRSALAATFDHLTEKHLDLHIEPLINLLERVLEYPKIINQVL